MRRRLLACLCAVALAWTPTQIYAQHEPIQDLSLMEVGSSSTISSSAARPLREVAELLVEANRNIDALTSTHDEYKVLANDIHVKRQTNIHLRAKTPPPATPPSPPAKKASTNAKLVEPLSQPQIHDPHRFGTKYPIKPGREYVTAQIVGEDGKPYLPRKQWSGISDEPETFRSPFAKFIHPKKVSSSADVVNKDPNTALTKVERKAIESMQLRLKNMLDRIGANIVWDHTPVANRKLISEYEAIKLEARTLMEEYELRTGVKTIAWQLSGPDSQGLSIPRGAVTDIHFSSQPELASRQLQRKGSHRIPEMSPDELAKLQAEHGVTPTPNAVDVPPKPAREQLVDVEWKRQADGMVKAQVNLHVVDSKVNTPEAPPATSSRAFIAGKRYKSGRIGPESRAVEIDVTAPTGEHLTRQNGMGELKQQDPAVKQAEAQQPKINM